MPNADDLEHGDGGGDGGEGVFIVIAATQIIPN